MICYDYNVNNFEMKSLENSFHLGEHTIVRAAFFCSFCLFFDVVAVTKIVN